MSAARSKKAVQPAPVITSQTAGALRQTLAEWYDRHRRDLPWRRTCDPYHVWVSEVMLQQTQVQTALPFYRRFIAQFPKISILARAELQSVLKLWEGLGYYSRARNLHKAAGIIETEMAGRFPDTWEALRRLPGIGDYIAAAVLSIAFDRAHAVVDGNVKRVLARLFMVVDPVNKASSHKVFNPLADRLLDRRRPGRHNQAMMELGALICTPRTPGCKDCPIRRFCMANQNGTVELYPARDRRRPVPLRRMVAGIVVKKKKMLMVQRPEHGLLGGLWEFPCGPMEFGDDPVRACLEQLKATVNLDAVVDRRLETVSHVYTHFKLQMDVCLCRWQSGRVRLNGHTRFKWVAVTDIGDLPLHGAAQKALAYLKKIALQPHYDRLEKSKDML